jgi:flagellar biosynthesis protein FlhG
VRDQATRLRELLAEVRVEAERPLRTTKRAHVIAVASGKGGVGKSNIALGLALALRAEGRSVILLDADLGTANLDVLLGLRPNQNLTQVIAGRAQLSDVIQNGPGGVRFLPGGSGLGADLSAVELRRLVSALRPLESEADFLVIDTGAGVSQAVTAFALAADTVIVVTTPEPTAMTDAYALMKTLTRENPALQLRLLVNRAESMQEASATTERLAATALQFLGTAVDPLPPVPEDRALVRAVKSQVPLLLAAPDSPAAAAIRRVARALIGRESEPRQGTGLFLDRLYRFLGRRS